MNLERFIETTRHREVVEHASQFGDNAGTGVRPAVAADEQHRHQSRIPAGQKRELGTVRSDGLNHANHVRDVARRILDGDDLGTFVRESLDGRHIDRTSKHRDVVERHIDRSIVADLFEIGINRLRAQLVVEGGHDRDGLHAERVVVLARFDRLAHIGFGGTRQDWNSTPSLIGDDLDDAATFFDGESRELAGRAVGIEAMHAAFDQPIHIASQLGFVDLAARVLRHQIGGKDAGESFSHSGLARSRTGQRAVVWFDAPRRFTTRSVVPL